MKRNCRFQIARGDTARYVYIFVYKGDYYNVTLKVLLSSKYVTLSVVKIQSKNILTFINTVVSSTY